MSSKETDEWAFPETSKPWQHVGTTAWIATDTSCSSVSTFRRRDLYFISVQLLGSGKVLVFLLRSIEFERRCKPVYMTGTTEGLPMDVAKEARLQQQQQDQKKELDRNDLVRARLLAISQVEPVGEVLPLDALKDVKGSPQPSPKGDSEDEFRRKLMSISYADVPMPAQ